MERGISSLHVVLLPTYSAFGIEIATGPTGFLQHASEEQGLSHAHVDTGAEVFLHVGDAVGQFGWSDG